MEQHKVNIRLAHQCVVKGKKPLVIHIANKEDRSTSTLLSLKNNSLVMVHNRQLNISHHNSSCKYCMGH